LPAFFKGMALTTELSRRRVAGVTEICPANAAYLVRFDPDIISPNQLVEQLKDVEASLVDAEMQLSTRIIEIPVLYNDPWTHETLMRFRERHQDPASTDLEYTAKINDLDGVDGFVKAHSARPGSSRWSASSPACPSSTRWSSGSGRSRSPKYLRPRTDTPKLTVGHGGCFRLHLLGARRRRLSDVRHHADADLRSQAADRLSRDFMCFFKPGDIVKWRPVTRDQYDRDIAAVEDGTFNLRIRSVTFSLKEFLADPTAYNAALVAQLNSEGARA
jgi:urea carboxylase